MNTFYDLCVHPINVGAPRGRCVKYEYVNGPFCEHDQRVPAVLYTHACSPTHACLQPYLHRSPVHARLQPFARMPATLFTQERFFLGPNPDELQEDGQKSL